MRRLAPLALLLLPLAAAPAEPPWSFVVLGDTRDRTTRTATGISPDLPALAAAVAAEKPDLVLHTGDLANGYYTHRSSPVHGKFREMLRRFREAMKPLGAPLYPVRGNHEDGKLVTDRDLRRAYLEEIGAFLPQDGPADEKGLTYTVRHKGALFVALDGYRRRKAGVVRGYVDQGWLEAALAREPRSFTFAFSHTPAWRVGDGHGAPWPNIASHRKARDRFWDALSRAGTLAYFCGHIHFYCRGSVRGIEQVVVGNGGANTVDFDPSKVDPALAIHAPAGAVRAADVRTGYLLMTVDETAGTVTGTLKLRDPATGAWAAGDTFTLSRRR